MKHTPHTCHTCRAPRGAGVTSNIVVGFVDAWPQALEDEDVIQIVKKKNADKGLNDPNNAKKGPEGMSRNQIKKTKKPLKS